jgi:eukaryotic-like serine/threonine-protein kinase
MRYCINPNCNGKENLPDAKLCLRCETSLLLENRFEVLRQISDCRPGHPFEVFRVRDTTNGQDKILKILIKYHSSTDPEILERKLRLNREILNKGAELFKRETEVLKKSTGYDGTPDFTREFEIDGDQTRPYMSCLVMELIEGKDLDEWLRENGKLTDRTVAIQWIERLANILDRLHNQGLFHRDIKPSNIIRKENGILVLIDFGSTAEMSAAVGSGGERTMVGSDFYAAPESKRNGYFVRQSDFFALGRTFVHLLTKRTHYECLIEVDEWQYDTDLRETGIIPLIDWFLRENELQRPQTGGEILKVTRYLNTRQDNGAFPNDEETKKFISGIQQPYSPTPESVASNASSVNPNDSITQKRPWVLIMPPPKIGISLAILAGIALIMNFIITKCIPTSPKDSSPTVSLTPAISPTTKPSEKVLISFGDRDDIDDDLVGIDQEEKKKAIELFMNKRYEAAYNKFYELWKIEQNQKQSIRPDPILLIYMNNAKVRYWISQPQTKRKIKKEISTIVVAAPIKDSRGIKILYGVAHAQNRVVQKNSTILSNSLNDEPNVYLEIGIVDDDNDKHKSPNIAEILGRSSITGMDGINRQVLTVIGHYTSEVTCEALKNYAKAGLPIISPTSSMDGLGQSKECNPDLKPVFFRTVSSSKLESQALIDFLYSKVQSGAIKNLRITAFYRQDDPKEKEGFSQNLFKVFQSQYKEKFGIELNEHIFNLAGDFNSGIEDMKKANVIVLFPDGKTSGSPAFGNSQEVIIAANKINQSQSNQIKLILASQPLLSTDIPVKEFKSWDGKFVMAVDWYRDCRNVNRGFIRQQNDLWGNNDLDRITAQSYEAGQVISKVLEKVSERPSILEKLTVLKEFNIKSGVFKNKELTFDKNTGNRDGMERILIGSKIASDETLRFPPIDTNQCR